MPLYEYLCGGCERKTEHLVLAGDLAANPVCPSCGSHEMHRLLSTFAAQAGDGGGKRADSFDASTACGGVSLRSPIAATPASAGRCADVGNCRAR